MCFAFFFFFSFPLDLLYHKTGIVAEYVENEDEILVAGPATKATAERQVGLEMPLIKYLLKRAL